MRHQNKHECYCKPAVVSTQTLTTIYKTTQSDSIQRHETTYKVQIIHKQKYINITMNIHKLQNVIGMHSYVP